ncbi:MAG TPA: hypothetical protein VF727_02800 [Allosphingosinicella sp.]|jgi:Flp pilus assembly protein CpaB
MSKADHLKEQAAKCRTLARGASTVTIALALREMAETYERRAARIGAEEREVAAAGYAHA